MIRPLQNFKLANLYFYAAFAFVVAGLLPAFAGAEQSQSPWRALPWHLVDYNYTLPETGAFKTLEIDMEIKGDVEAGSFLYLSPVWGRLEQAGFYFGLQTDVFKGRGGSFGKGVILSRWGKGRHSDARAAPGGWSFIGAKATSGEGDFVSVRRLYEWKSGRYTFLLKARPPLTGDNSGTWIDLSVQEHATGKWIDAGGLRFPARHPRLRKRLVSFVEIYSAKKRPLADVPENLNGVVISFGDPLVNLSYKPVKKRASFYPKVPRRIDVIEGEGGAVLTFRVGRSAEGNRGPSDDQLD